MADKSKPMSFPMAMMDFFGRKPGQSPAEFVKELAALDANDKAYFTKGLVADGYTITASPQPAAA